MVSMFGSPPPGMVFHPTRRRYPFIAARLPAYFLRAPRLLADTSEAVDSWWRREVTRIPGLDLAGSLDAFAGAVAQFETALAVQIGTTLGSIQPVFDQLDALITRAGVGDLGLLSGSGGAEIAVVTDIWRASRSELTVADVVRNHGFHGPAEGEISSRVWREDDNPLRNVIEHYRSLPESENPVDKERDKQERRRAMTREVLAALPRPQRPGAALLLKLARDRIPGRGRAKRSFLQTIDVARAAARRAGEHLAAQGRLDRADDVFHLTGDELRAGAPAEAGALIGRRRERRAAYGRLRFAAPAWSGMPDVRLVAGNGPDPSDLVFGLGASPGVVEGVVRVVQDPSFLEVEPGEVLVAPTTDPSWCSIMYVSVALVVDLGGMLSHTAVVARELDIPCVVNTGDATRRLRTGDLVRVDGRAGSVRVLKRRVDG
jgi:pyruvate,water dikinase